MVPVNPNHSVLLCRKTPQLHPSEGTQPNKGSRSCIQTASHLKLLSRETEMQVLVTSLHFCGMVVAFLCHKRAGFVIAALRFKGKAI